MTTIRAIAARLFSGSRSFDNIAIGNLTDSQMRRSGLSKAEMLHTTFSGLATNS